MRRYDEDQPLLDREVPFKTALFLSCVVPAAFCGLFGMTAGSALPYAAMGGVLGPTLLTLSDLPQIIKNFKNKRINAQQRERDARMQQWRAYQRSKQMNNSRADALYNAPATPEKSSHKDPTENPNYDIWAIGGRYFGRKEDR